MEHYKEDLAYIHDVGYGGFAAGAAPGLLALLRRNGIRDGLVIDLGCGSGIWARELGRAGYEVLGIDISRSMIRLARNKAPKAKFLTASFLEAELPRCVAVTAIGECLSYCFEPGSGKQRLVQLFERIFAALRPGGVLIFDIAGPAGRTRRIHSQGDDWAVLVEGAQDERAVLTRRITSFRKIGKLYRRSEETHCQRLYKSSELAVELRRVGFRVRVMRGYGEFRLPRANAGFLARKPG
jgi:SAM-dependent methyltransferase